MSELPDWLLTHLTRIGAHNPDGISRAARNTRCARCARPVLRGLDADRAALVAECDVDEIDGNGELVALAIGLRTYTLSRTVNSNGKAILNLDPRTPDEISRGAAKPILPQHRCGIAIPCARMRHTSAWAPRALPAEPDF